MRTAAASEFPDPRRAPPNGPLAASRDLEPARLLDAYAHGIFPWFDSDEQPVLWWSPDPRAVLSPDRLHVSKSLAKRIRSRRFRITVDQAFGDVVAGCAAPRAKSAAVVPASDAGTWITPRMQHAYGELFELGFAHSVEAWHDGVLVGGLYGVSLGRMFFGESMFSAMADASKVALVFLARQLHAWQFPLIDCQIMNDHLYSLGARNMPRRRFLRVVNANNAFPTRRGHWSFDV